MTALLSRRRRYQPDERVLDTILPPEALVSIAAMSRYLMRQPLGLAGCELEEQCRRLFPDRLTQFAISRRRPGVTVSFDPLRGMVYRRVV